MTVSVEDVDARCNVLNQPVKTLEQTVPGVGAAADDLPVPVPVHHLQIQNLKHKHTQGKLNKNT